jgi:hypothetical protein
LRDTAEAPQGGLDPPELERRSSMKYVILGNLARTRRRQSRRDPSRFSASGRPPRGRRSCSFLGRIDSPGGFAVVETDDPALIARDTGIFSAFFDFTVYPVLDIEDAARIGAESLEFLRSA